MPSDEQWSDLEPPIEACRPHAKVPSPHRRRTVEAILRRRRNGAKWRSLPAEFGPWRMAAQTFIRRARLGVWEKLLAAGPRARRAAWHGFPGWHRRPCPSEGGRRQPKGGSAKKRDGREVLGRSRGGYGTKACVMADGAGRAIAFCLAPGQAHELPHAIPLLDRMPGVPKWVVADRGTTSHAFRRHIWDMGAHPAIPPLRHEAPSPARTGSPTTATGSSACGRSSRNGVPSPLGSRENCHQLSRCPLPRRNPRLAQAMTGPSRNQ